MKNSEIIVCSGIKLDRDYENVLSYNEESMVNLCRNNQIYQGVDYNYLGGDDYIDVTCPYSVLFCANYVAFINPNYGNKWMFAWVTEVELLNPSVTRLYIKMDVFSTWYSRFNVGQAFIEREHVSDDTVGKHTIPEGLETGDYKCASITSLFSGGNTTYIIIATTWLPSEIDVSSYIAEYNGVYSAAVYLAFEDTLSASKFIKIADSYSKADSIIAVFIAPQSLCNNVSLTVQTIIDNDGVSRSVKLGAVPYTTSATSMATSSNITSPSSIDSYTPKNNKLFVWPYNYFYVSNNVGTDIDFKYEDFVNKTASFKIVGSLTPGCSIRCVPLNYKQLSDSSSLNSFNSSITGAKYPVCSWQSDAYTNWLTQNGVNIALSTIGGAGAGALAVLGIMSGGVGAIAAMGALAGSAMTIGNTMAQVYEHSLIPPQAKGNQNSGDVTFSADKMNFPLYKMTIKQEYAKCIDSYFSRFGYKVNEVKTPSLTSRTKFNFIKVGGMDELIHGDIPSTDLEEINNIFRKGVTIFHNYNDIGDYTVTNSIVS